jgi:hypothetical protein
MPQPGTELCNPAHSETLEPAVAKLVFLPWWFVDHADPLLTVTVNKWTIIHPAFEGEKRRIP